MGNVSYFLDGVNFNHYGVFVSESKGVINRPKLKQSSTFSWDNYHGNVVDLKNKYYEPREIILSCFIKAENKVDFLMRVMEFERLFDKTGTQRLMIQVEDKPLVYEVFCKDEIAISKKWSDAKMIGTFELKLIEPEPVKRVLKHTRTGEPTKNCEITLTSTKLLNIYWGDGNSDTDIAGDDITVSHDYEADGDYFVIVTGCIDEIIDFATNATTVWNKL